MQEHPHPVNFRLVRTLDRGWGEMACEYRWDSSSGIYAVDLTTPDLAHCLLYEYTTYADNPGHYSDGWYSPPDPPFLDWRFRHPTDGRNTPVGMECFPATQGWAWDRHKIVGRLLCPESPQPHLILALQTFRFHCTLCNLDAPLLEPHSIERRFAPHDLNQKRWRYSLTKHNRTVWLDLTADDYLDDSAHIGFSPW